MAAFKQDQLIDQLHNQIEAILNKSVSDWQLIQHSRFAKRPSEGAWSANECLQHLNSYGRYYLPAIEAALSQQPSLTSSPKIFTSGWLGGYFTKIMTPSTDGSLSKKMKSPKDHSPQTILESYTVMSEFIEQQEKLLQLLSKARQTDLNKVKVSISIAAFIKLKLGDVFMFLIAHIHRHSQQAERALNNA